jgi:hypothetical protein
MIAVQSLMLAGVQVGHAQSLDCWTLSNHYLRERFPSVEVWADVAGEDWLREAGMHYDAWHRLPAVGEEMGHLWCIGKLLTAAEQTGPFLHVDGDVFWRQAPPEAPFLVQHDEGPRSGWWQRAGFGPMAMPPAPHCYNFGIFGGLAWREIAGACRAVLDCLDDHRALVAGCGCSFLPMLVEQVWVPALLAAQGIQPTCLLRADHLQEDARTLNYFHAQGGKSLPATVAAIAERLAALNTPRASAA